LPSSILPWGPVEFKAAGAQFKEVELPAGIDFAAREARRFTRPKQHASIFGPIVFIEGRLFEALLPALTRTASDRILPPAKPSPAASPAAAAPAKSSRAGPLADAAAGSAGGAGPDGVLPVGEDGCGAGGCAAPAAPGALADWLHREVAPALLACPWLEAAKEGTDGDPFSRIRGWLTQALPPAMGTEAAGSFMEDFERNYHTLMSAAEKGRQIAAANARNACATTIEQHERGRQARGTAETLRQAAAIRRAACLIQSGARGWLARRRFAMRVAAADAKKDRDQQSIAAAHAQAVGKAREVAEKDVGAKFATKRAFELKSELEERGQAVTSGDSKQAMLDRLVELEADRIATATLARLNAARAKERAGARILERARIHQQRLDLLKWIAADNIAAEAASRAWSGYKPRYSAKGRRRK
jgi:hypothetical protein